MMIIENSYFAGQLSYRRERDVIRRTTDICVCRKRKLELIQRLETPET